MARKYKFARFIEDGMTRVFLAEDREKHPYVIKVEAPDRDGMIQREFDILGILQHPNIVRSVEITPANRIKDCPEDIDLNGDDDAIVTEYVEGRRLADVVHPVQTDLLMMCARHVSDALCMIVDKGLAHGDLCGWNIMTGGSEAVVIDFEDALWLSEGYGNEVRTHFDFAPVEAFFGELQRNSDVYSLGKIIYMGMHPNTRSIPDVAPSKNVTSTMRSSKRFLKELVVGDLDPNRMFGITGPKEVGMMGSEDLKGRPRLQRLLEAMLEHNYKNRPQPEEVRKELYDV